MPRHRNNAKANKRSSGWCRHVWHWLVTSAIVSSIVVGLTLAYYHWRIISFGFGDQPVVSPSPAPALFHAHSCTCVSNSAADWVKETRLASKNDSLSSSLSHSPCACGVHDIHYTTLPANVELLNETLIHPFLRGRPALRCCASATHGATPLSCLESDSDSGGADGADDAEEQQLRALFGPLCRASFRKRYVLTNVVPGRRYMLHLSFLGSPSVGYVIRYLHVPRCAVVRALRRGQASSARENELYRVLQNNHRLGECDGAASFRPLDTEVRMFRMHEVTPNMFNHAEVHVEMPDVGEFTGNGGAASRDAHANESVMAVIDVEPRLLAMTHNPNRFPTTHYNIEFVPLIWNMLPKIWLPYIITMTAITVAAVQLSWNVDMEQILYG